MTGKECVIWTIVMTFSLFDEIPDWLPCGVRLGVTILAAQSNASSRSELRIKLHKLRITFGARLTHCSALQVWRAARVGSLF